MTGELDIAHRTALDPSWLGSLLGVELAGLTTQPIGTGQVAASLRVTLAYAGDRPEGAPASVVVKLPSPDPVSRASGVALGSYLTESSFYRDLAARLPIRTPRCHHVEIDPVSNDFVLVLEDMAPAVQGDQLTGCSPDEAAVAVDELPKLHGPRWGDPGLGDLTWLRGDGPERGAMTAAFITSLHAGFTQRYEGRLEPDVAVFIEQMLPKLAGHLTRDNGPSTVQHGDYRLDNMLFATTAGASPVAIVDWQTVLRGPGIVDLSYFIGAGLVPEARREVETALVEQYHRGMKAFGVDLDWDWLWDQYRRHTVAGVVMAIGASMVVGQTERGDEMFMAMANRHARHAIDLDWLQLQL